MHALITIIKPNRCPNYLEQTCKHVWSDTDLTFTVFWQMYESLGEDLASFLISTSAENMAHLRTETTGSQIHVCSNGVAIKGMSRFTLIQQRMGIRGALQTFFRISKLASGSQYP